MKKDSENNAMIETKEMEMAVPQLAQFNKALSVRIILKEEHLSVFNLLSPHHLLHLHKFVEMVE